MSHIKSKDTSIEWAVRKYLFSQGYRYRVNYEKLPGKPDVVFTKKKLLSLFMGAFGTGMVAGAVMPIPVNPIKNTGCQK